MTFDACEHRIRQLILQAGRVIRQLKGLPETNDLTLLYEETAPLVGQPLNRLSSLRDGNRLPTPQEMAQGKAGHTPYFSAHNIVPPKPCACGKKLVLSSICGSCIDSEKGKYKTMWYCGTMDKDRNLVPGTGCGRKEKSDKFYLQWLNELVPDWESTMKQQAGIKTVTDEGLK
jgi:hypothetical protein